MVCVGNGAAHLHVGLRHQLEAQILILSHGRQVLLTCVQSDGGAGLSCCQIQTIAHQACVYA